MIRQRGSHIRLQKVTSDGIRKMTVPAHRPIKRSTLSYLIKQAGLAIPVIPSQEGIHVIPQLPSSGCFKAEDAR